MNLLGIYTVGVARSLCRRLLLGSNRKLSIVMALSTTFMQYAPETTKFGKITQNKGHLAVQGHSRSPISVPIESSYMASYIKMIAS